MTHNLISNGKVNPNLNQMQKKSLPEDKGPDVPADASSSKDKAPEPSLTTYEKVVRDKQGLTRI
ncbi:hypothetical protein YC2023_078911 [Brassica napus]